MVLEEFKKALVKQEFEIPNLSDGQILVKVLASGVCGSDVHIAKGEDPRAPLPLILGHEGVGKVVEIVGEKSDLFGSKIQPGDLIIWNRGIVCCQCFWCKVARQPFLCPNRRIYGINMSCRDHPYLLGAYSEYMILLKGTDVLKLEKNLDPAILVVAGCSGATAMHAFDVLTEPLVGKIVVVQGAGPLGVFCLVAAKSLGASVVILISGSKQRLDIAKQAGADIVLSRYEQSEEERYRQVMNVTNTRGADVVIEATGSSEALSEGLRLLRRGGTYLVTGVAVPQHSILMDVYHDLVLKNANIHGIWVSDSRHLVQAVKLIEEHPKLFEKLITHRLKLEQANEALQLVEERKALKAVLVSE